MKTKKVAKISFQQGDLYGVKLQTMPQGDQKIIARKYLTLAHGESGHSHVIEDDEAELIQIGERMILKSTKAVTLQHVPAHPEAHKPIRLSPGIWDIGRVREWDPFQEMSRHVMD